jgi:hypothetical protein
MLHVQFTSLSFTPLFVYSVPPPRWHVPVGPASPVVTEGDQVVVRSEVPSDPDKDVE